MYRLGLSHPVKYPYKTGPQTPNHIIHYTTNNGVDIALASGSCVGRETLEHPLILKLGLTDMYLGMKTKDNNEKKQSISIDVFSIRCDKWRCASSHFLVSCHHCQSCIISYLIEAHDLVSKPRLVVTSPHRVHCRWLRGQGDSSREQRRETKLAIPTDTSWNIY